MLFAGFGNRSGSKKSHVDALSRSPVVDLVNTSTKEKVNTYVGNCIKCIVHSAPRRSSERSLYSIPKRPVPFDTIHLDHFGPLPSLITQRKHLLVIIDAFTKFVRLYPVNSTSTKEVYCALANIFTTTADPYV